MTDLELLRHIGISVAVIFATAISLAALNSWFGG